MKLIAGNSNRRLSESISNKLTQPLALADIRTFKDGEVGAVIAGSATPKPVKRTRKSAAGPADKKQADLF